MFGAGAASLLTLYILGCPGAPKAQQVYSDATSVSEIAEALISGAVNSTVSGGTGTQAYLKHWSRPDLQIASTKMNLASEIIGNLNPVQNAEAQRIGVNGCPVLSNLSWIPNTNPPNSVASNCVLTGTTQVLVPLAVCYFTPQPSTVTNPIYVTWSGNEIFTKTGGSTALSCAAFPTMAAGDTMTRAFTNPTSRMTPNNVIVLLDTSGALEGVPPVATTGFSITYIDPVTRTIQLNGIHLAASIANYIVWDYVATSNVMNVNGAGAATSGTITMQNLHSKTGAITTTTSQITSTLTFTAGCCMATGGTITSTLADGSTETLNMTGTCGAATLNGTPINLTHCW